MKVTNLIILISGTFAMPKLFNNLNGQDQLTGYGNGDERGVGMTITSLRRYIRQQHKREIAKFHRRAQLDNILNRYFQLRDI